MANANTQQATMSETNRSRILQHLYHNGISSRAQIAKALELTPAAITKITAKLLDAGVIEETGDLEGIKNRRSIGLAINTNKYHVIGVKFARSLVQIGVFSLNGTHISLTNLPTVHEDSIYQTVQLIRDNINTLVKQDPNIVAIGMAVPGPYLRDAGHTAVVSSMQGWKQVNFINEFINQFDIPVFVEQDARAGALAQYLFNPDVAGDDLAYYLLGEGIGLGIISRGELFYGAHGTASELGHVSINPNGIPCDCGNIGCLERYCSAVAIHNQLRDNPGLVPDCDDMTHVQACQALFQKAGDGDKAAQRLVKTMAQHIGYGCVTIINMFNPSRIVMGDILVQAGQPLLDEVNAVVQRRVIPQLAQATTISLSTLPTDAATSGAAAVAITNFLEHPSMFFELN